MLRRAATNPTTGGPTAGRLLHILVQAGRSWSGDRVFTLAGAVSYFAILSIAPLLYVVTVVSGLLVEPARVRETIHAQLQDFVGSAASRAITQMVDSLLSLDRSNSATAIGVAALLVGASAVFGQLQAALDLIWRSQAPVRESGWWTFVRSRLFWVGLVLGLIFLLSISFLSYGVADSVTAWSTPLLGDWQTAADTVHSVVSFGVLATGFAVLYRLMPRCQVAWRDVWLGGMVAALLSVLGKYALGAYYAQPCGHQLRAVRTDGHRAAVGVLRRPGVPLWRGSLLGLCA